MKEHEIVQAQADREALADELTTPVSKALDAKKLGPDRVACILDQAARAKTISHHKIKGLMKENSLGKSHRVVATAQGIMEDEHLVAHSAPNHAIRMKAADAIIQLRGLAPKEEAGGIFGGSVINVFTNIEPRKRLDRAALARVANVSDDAD